MVNYEQELDATFLALADPTRRAILAALATGSSSVTELAKPYQISLPAVMKHLRILERAGLVSQQKTGRVRQCTLAPKPLKKVSDWLAHYEVFWEEKFDALERYLKQTQLPSPEDSKCRKRPYRRPSRS